MATSMSNLGLERFLAGRGLSLARTDVGDRYVVEHMRSHGFNLGGEQSGHIVMSDYSTTGDGLIAALQILACIVTSGNAASHVTRCFEKVPQLLKSVRFSVENPLEHDRIQAAIEQGKMRLGNHGRLVIRKSGTEPLVRVMAEGDDADLVAHVVHDICQVVEAAA
ncbi:hypothetical protein JCM17844_27450 [Iodidimonas gelatinilytica]|uniref:Phosphoglucosamine mutase n=1 Tax=Iodidimonas gelatinilytica TaxID=1236966 RepID=A0A5A7MVN8_9PROT|nr:hypothetical protein [Iodidimonas gelatinilytica]GEQ99108.1 hypothetical protein JCM17844_27450 [Iodidimonas gelatinilytica]